MQPRRGRGDAAGRAGIDRLITILIFRRCITLDIMRQRRHSNAIDDLEKITFVIEPHGASARSCIVYDFAPQFAVIKINLIADAYFTRRIDYNVPDIFFSVQFTQQKDFNFRIRLFFLPIEPCLKHTRLIDCETITLLKIICDFIELSFFNSFVNAVHHHETRVIAWICRLLPYQVTRKRIFEIGELHCSYPFYNF